nr:transcription antitermination factor NusB [Consotaella salsifontis]
MGLSAPRGGPASKDRQTSKGRPKSGPSHVEPAAEARPGLAVRMAAAKLLSAVVDSRVSADGLTDPAGGHPAFRALDARDQGLVKAILVTALRFRGTIGAALEGCLDRPLPAGALSLAHLLHVGAAQILHLDVPDSAAVDLAVAAALADPRNRRFSGLVNAVLRRVSREKAELLAAADPRRDTPAWLYERLVAAYGEEEATAIATLHRLPAPLDLSVKSDPERWARELGGIVLPTGSVRLAELSGPVTALPGFEDGEWWVQDAAAALPARLFRAMGGKRIADLCAAPGGKTAQLAAAGAKVTALDLSASRRKRLDGNLARLRLDAETLVQDLRTYQPETLFDGVLLDAPCSSTGTIRRHPDVAYTKGPEEIEKLAGVQAGLLDAAAALVAPGGTLVFSNCSLDPVEGEGVARSFLAAHADFALDAVAAAELPGLEAAVTQEGFVRTTPATLRLSTPALSGLDGFFAARFVKNS